MSDPKFSCGDRVWKTGTYSGPGDVVSVFEISSGKGEWRYVVAHELEGGTGRLLHIYTGTQLEKI